MAISIDARAGRGSRSPSWRITTSKRPAANGSLRIRTVAVEGSCQVETRASSIVTTDGRDTMSPTRQDARDSAPEHH